ncbi:hypothetical protein ABZX40_04625 [Streptomyces sp. NPDC004610]
MHEVRSYSRLRLGLVEGLAGALLIDSLAVLWLRGPAASGPA